MLYTLPHLLWVIIPEMLLNLLFEGLFGLFDAKLQLSSGSSVQGLATCPEDCIMGFEARPGFTGHPGFLISKNLDLFCHVLLE